MSAEFTSGRKNGRQRPRGYIEDWRPQRATLQLIEQVREVLEQYVAHLPLTVRQVFYALVGRYGFDKTERAYGRLCHHLVMARRAKAIPFKALRDDRTTNVWTPWHADVEHFWDDVADRANAFRLDRQEGQKVRIELSGARRRAWSPQLHRVAGKYSVTTHSNGGFASLHAVRQIVTDCCSRDVPIVLLHVGDFDPSGESVFEAMTEDVMAFLKADRVIETQRLIPERVALTAEQIAEHGLPTAPPKPTDSRSKRWKGETCQAEALPPDTLAGIVRDAIEAHLDLDRVDEQIERERRERTGLLRALPRGTS